MHEEGSNREVPLVCQKKPFGDAPGSTTVMDMIIVSVNPLRLSSSNCGCCKDRVKAGRMQAILCYISWHISVRSSVDKLRGYQSGFLQARQPVG